MNLSIILNCMLMTFFCSFVSQAMEGEQAHQNKAPEIGRGSLLSALLSEDPRHSAGAPSAALQVQEQSARSSAQVFPRAKAPRRSRNTLPPSLCCPVMPTQQGSPVYLKDSGEVNLSKPDLSKLAQMVVGLSQGSVSNYGKVCEAIHGPIKEK